MYISFTMIVRILAFAITVAGIVFAVWPKMMKSVCDFVAAGKRLYFVAAIRIAAGIILLLAAQGHARRVILATFGVIILLAGISQLVITLERQRSIMNWMTSRSEVTQRLLGIGVIFAGGLMMMATFLD